MAPQSSVLRRGPSVLVTDAREAAPQPQSQSRRSSSRFITVDSVLQHASEIPSMQQRQPQRPRPFRTPSGRPAAPRLTGDFGPRNLPVPSRSTKVSEKLVLLPDTDGDAEDESEDVGEKGDWGEDNEASPLRDDEELRRRAAQGLEKVKSYAERLPKSRRAEKLARVTAYCTAQEYKLQATAEFLREKHGVRTKLYDDCLYVAYHLPLLPGTEGYRVRSSPALKSAGGKAVLDEEIERNERRDYWEGYFIDTGEDEHSVQGESPRDSPADSPGERERIKRRDGISEEGTDHRGHSQQYVEDPRPGSDHTRRPMSPPLIPSNVFSFAEMFIFTYGVAVFWNFSEKQERDILADLTFSVHNTRIQLVTLPLREEDFETEEFHFEYSADIPRPRVYNDMITLRSGDHMIKLTMSHAIAQSTKLSFFEERMSVQMEGAKDVPKRLALTGELGMKRAEVVKILGALFKSRVDVNLSSNILDVPPFFWTSEPTLNPLYTAVREYLEIKPRTIVLNERCRVFLDLAEILSDSIADNKMSRLTWIIIALIVLSILVTCSEVFLRFGILTKRGSIGAGHDTGGEIVLGKGHIDMDQFWRMVSFYNCSCPATIPGELLRDRRV